MPANLILHCGARAVDREQVDRAPTPPRTRSHVPIPHGQLLDLVESTLTASGLRIHSEAHALWGEGDRYFGLLELVDRSSEEDYHLVVGVRNSHDRAFAAALAVGTSVMVCDNLSFSSTVVLARKHTVHISRDMPQVVERAVGRLGDLRQSQDDRIAIYKHTELSNLQVHDLLIQSIDAQVLPVTRIPNVLGEWREPRHPEFAREGRTAWRLHNAFTQNLKGNLGLLPRRTEALAGLLDSSCGLGRIHEAPAR